MQTALIQKLQKIPAHRLPEVENFIDFIITNENRITAANKLGLALAKLDAVDMQPISDAEIEEEIKCARQQLAIKRA